MQIPQSLEILAYTGVVPLHNKEIEGDHFEQIPLYGDKLSTTDICV